MRPHVAICSSSVMVAHDAIVTGSACGPTPDDEHSPHSPSCPQPARHSRQGIASRRDHAVDRHQTPRHVREVRASRLLRPAEHRLQRDRTGHGEPDGANDAPGGAVVESQATDCEQP